MAQLNIDELVADLRPVRRLSSSLAWALVLGLTAAAIVVVNASYGLRSDVINGNPAGIVLLRGGTLLLLGSAALSAIVAAARPGVGQAQQGWRWALGAALLFPLAAIVIAVLRVELPMAELTASSAIWCMGISGASGAGIALPLTLWLRRGAPVSLNRAGWLVGLTAGAFGTFAYNLHCPSETVQYIGVWYTAAIAACSSLCRLIVPRFLRW